MTCIFGDFSRFRGSVTCRTHYYNITTLCNILHRLLVRNHLFTLDGYFTRNLQNDWVVYYNTSTRLHALTVSVEGNDFTRQRRHDADANVQFSNRIKTFKLCRRKPRAVTTTVPVLLIIIPAIMSFIVCTPRDDIV